MTVPRSGRPRACARSAGRECPTRRGVCHATGCCVQVVAPSCKELNVVSDHMNSKIVEKDENSQCIAVSATGDSMESPLDPRFGRCSYFIVVEADGSHRAVRNPGQDSASGAGTQAAQKVVDLGVKVVITGNLGPNAFMVLDGSGIAAFMKPVGTVSAAIEAYKRGELTRMGSWTSPGHHGHGPHGPNRNG